MTIAALKHAFATHHIDKPEYIAKAYCDFHAILFDYASNLAATDIQSITIDAHGVIFTVRSSGLKIRCQPGDHRSPPFETFNFADFEPAESKMMRKLFDGQRSFYDIGANIGWHSLTLATAFREAHFFCFEPIPDTYAHLQENIRLNTLSNISTYNIALSNTNGAQDFFVYTACSGNASARNLSSRDDVRTVTCQQICLDDLLKEQNLAAPDFIKCDVEGAELMVLQGASHTLKHHQPVVMAEILRKWSAQYNYNPNDIFNLFDTIGYQAFTTDGYSLIPFGRMTEETQATNFFFLHRTRHTNLIERYITAKKP